MRVLLDSNVLISAFISNGVCSELLDHCIITHTVVTSNYILSEFSEKLITKFYYSPREVSTARKILEEQCEIVNPEPLRFAVSRDVKDDPILAAALEGHCDCLITGDKDLLVLRTFQGIPILKPSAFADWEITR